MNKLRIKNAELNENMNLALCLRHRPLFTGLDFLCRDGEPSVENSLAKTHYFLQSE
jgi:hypothetical protein